MKAVVATAEALGWIERVNASEPSLTIVKLDRPKRLTGLTQNGTRTVISLLGRDTLAYVPPVERWGPPDSFVVIAEQGKPDGASSSEDKGDRKVS